ncbi:hypothetical protein FA15DRAFT_605046 [Coprinopsis marcescibilis]|uniref:P-loop containing nucleoside triphosphate hydrolase protein n=1 Tax=Coprinopsis marcescibilis TaxID=230819 RepID=A0A5C3KCG3_COPMA|nr:hypothetical protein FA15DRAFT_605046 [Coprinopsis marcescibilis]
MPSHTNSSGLVKLWFASQSFPGAPWTFEGWQEITGITHGLFPTDDKLLPPGWTRETADAVYAYFDEYNNQTSEDDKIRLAIVPRGIINDPIPGRRYWRDWVTVHWGKKWNIHTRISKALTNCGLHPVQLVIDSGDLDLVPSAGLYLSAGLDAIGLALFGTDCLDKSGHLHPHLREPTLVFAQRTWQMACRSIGPKKKRLMELEEKATDALKVLQDPRGTKVSVSSVNGAIKAIAAYQRAVEAIPTAHMMEIAENLKGDLEPFIPIDPVSTVKPSKAPSGEGSKIPSLTIATEDEVAQILDLYDLYLGQDFVSTEPLDTEAILTSLAESSSDDQCGVDIESTLDSETLANRLGFPDGRPFFFNDKRHKGELTPWNVEFDKLVVSHPDLFQPFCLHWHQLCGAHAIINNALSRKNTLLGDGVGVGKTVQAASVMAFFSDLSHRQEIGKPLPTIAVERPYMGGKEKVPNRPHLIVVPGTLLRQTEHEFRCFFKPKFFDILVYPTGLDAHADFFKPGGIWKSSKHDPRMRILVASQSSVQQDYGSLYSNARPHRALPWDPSERLFTYSARVGLTLYGLEYLTVTWDEAQGIRNAGAKHLAALRLFEQSCLRIIMTATPIQTSVKDISAMGRTIDIPYFMTEQAHRDSVTDAAAIRRAKLEREDHDPNDDSVSEVQAEICARLRGKFEGRVIRRTSNSLNSDGKPLIQLPELHIVRGGLRLTERELQILDIVTIPDLQDASLANSRNITSNNFYLEHRMGVSFARETANASIPLFTSIADWEEKKSTKIDCLVRMVQHILLRDDMPPIEFVDGAPVFGPAPSSPTFTRDIKVLVYQEFPAFMGLVRSVFALHGIPVLSISGKTGYDQRAAVVNKFDNDPDSRVLIFSKVGSTGLNLTRASVIIFLDQPWSAQDEAQSRGRPHRQGQKRPVWAYHLLAMDTADPILSALAAGKKDLLDSFILSKSSLGMLHFDTYLPGL